MKRENENQQEFQFDSSIIHQDHDAMLKKEGHNAFMKTLVVLHDKGNIKKWLDFYPDFLDSLYDNYTDKSPFAEGFKEALKEASYAFQEINQGIDPLSGEDGLEHHKNHLLNMYIGLLEANM